MQSLMISDSQGCEAQALNGSTATSFAEAALQDHCFRETSMMKDFLDWRQQGESDPSRLPEFGMTITGESISGGVCAVIRHRFGGTISSGPVMLNTNDPDPYNSALTTAARIVLAVVRA